MNSPASIRPPRVAAHEVAMLLGIATVILMTVVLRHFMPNSKISASPERPVIKRTTPKSQISSRKSNISVKKVARAEQPASQPPFIQGALKDKGTAPLNVEWDALTEHLESYRPSAGPPLQNVSKT